ncbi:hypothetical protein ABI59_10340 [Acidobacteria bacterium Mor1]|nr:hypothetical protein ABI59_10340 [Acidobacteria bacterium Mor1]
MRHATLIVAALLALMCASEARAICNPPRSFGSGTPGNYFYLRLGNETGSQANQIGRFWEPTLREVRNEGTYDDEIWINEYYPGTDGWYLRGNLGEPGPEGCIEREMLVVVEDLVDMGEGLRPVLTLGRIDRTLGELLVYDFTRLERDWTSAPLPEVDVLSQTTAGDSVVLELALPALNEVSNTLEGLEAGDTLVAYQVRQAAVDRGAPAPSFGIAPWVVAGEIGYTGEPVDRASVSIDCSDSSKDVYAAISVRFIDDVVTSYVGPAQQIACPDANFEFARFEPRLALLSFGLENADAFSLVADYGLDPDSDGIDPANEAVRLDVGRFRLELPAGSFECAATTCRYDTGDVQITITEGRLVVRLSSVDLAGNSNEVDVALIVGNDQVADRLELIGRLGLPRIRD